MALRLLEFFGAEPGKSPVELPFSSSCPYTKEKCSKPRHGGCSATAKDGEPVIFCPSRMYGQNFFAIIEVAKHAFGRNSVLVTEEEFLARHGSGALGGNEVIAFSKHFGKELRISKTVSRSEKARNFYLDWVLVKVDEKLEIVNFCGIEVQTVDTSNNYNDQVEVLSSGKPFVDAEGSPKFSSAGFNWENVNKRIIPQLVQKAEVLSNEDRAKAGLYYVCPVPVLRKMKERLSAKISNNTPDGSGRITILSFRLKPSSHGKLSYSLMLEEEYDSSVAHLKAAFMDASPDFEPNTLTKEISKKLQARRS